MTDKKTVDEKKISHMRKYMSVSDGIDRTDALLNSSRRALDELFDTASTLNKHHMLMRDREYGAIAGRRGYKKAETYITIPLSSHKDVRLALKRILKLNTYISKSVKSIDDSHKRTQHYFKMMFDDYVEFRVFVRDKKNRKNMKAVNNG